MALMDTSFVQRCGWQKPRRANAASACLVDLFLTKQPVCIKNSARCICYRMEHDRCASVAAIPHGRRRVVTAPIERRRFGRTGLEVTALGYGAMEIRGPRIWSGRELTDAQ